MRYFKYLLLCALVSGQLAKLWSLQNTFCSNCSGLTNLFLPSPPGHLCSVLATCGSVQLVTFIKTLGCCPACQPSRVAETLMFCIAHRLSTKHFRTCHAYRLSTSAVVNHLKWPWSGWKAKSDGLIFLYASHLIRVNILILFKVNKTFKCSLDILILLFNFVN